MDSRLKDVLSKRVTGEEAGRLVVADVIRSIKEDAPIFSDNEKALLTKALKTDKDLKEYNGYVELWRTAQSYYSQIAIYVLGATKRIYMLKEAVEDEVRAKQENFLSLFLPLIMTEKEYQDKTEEARALFVKDEYSLSDVLGYRIDHIYQEEKDRIPELIEKYRKEKVPEEILSSYYKNGYDKETTKESFLLKEMTFYCNEDLTPYKELYPDLFALAVRDIEALIREGKLAGLPPDLTSIQPDKYEDYKTTGEEICKSGLPEWEDRWATPNDIVPAFSDGRIAILKNPDPKLVNEKGHYSPPMEIQGMFSYKNALKKALEKNEYKEDKYLGLEYLESVRKIGDQARDSLRMALVRIEVLRILSEFTGLDLSLGVAKDAKEVWEEIETLKDKMRSLEKPRPSELLKYIPDLNREELEPPQKNIDRLKAKIKRSGIVSGLDYQGMADILLDKGAEE